MPMASAEAAKDAILKVFADAWATITPTPPKVIYEPVKTDTPDGDEECVMVIVRHTDGFQPTIGSANGRRFRATGVVWTMVFTPLELNDGGTLALQRAKVIQDAYEAPPAGGDTVEYRNVRLVEIGPQGAWYRVNVLADFNYDRVKP